jgi:hypothetical protein
MESFREKLTDRAFARTCWTIDRNNHSPPLIQGASPVGLVVLVLSLNVAFYPIVMEISSFLLRPLLAAGPENRHPQEGSSFSESCAWTSIKA